MPEEVTVVRKNARMHITVRGLDDGVPEERYYFTVQAPNDGYDFNGKPMAGTATVRRAGTFGPNGDFATVGTFNMIHTDTPDDAETGVGVSLYERMTVRSADRLVAAVTTDDDGMPISLPAGQLSLIHSWSVGIEDVVARFHGVGEGGDFGSRDVQGIAQARQVFCRDERLVALYVDDRVERRPGRFAVFIEGFGAAVGSAPVVG